eukprot:m.9583 g.9583  ORF g.9583 m.9583 type:complete len:126 (-) comp6961_c0_seq1:176-553(-)
MSMRKLGRDTSHRIAMLRTMTTQLIKYQRIKTTVAKAKELRRPAEKMVTLAKRGEEDTWAKKQASGYLREPAAVDFLFTTLADRYKDRPGGYTRVLRAGYRKGDNAPMAIIEYVDNDLPSITDLR